MFHVKAHAGNIFNELADKLAGQAYEKNDELGLTYFEYPQWSPGSLSLSIPGRYFESISEMFSTLIKLRDKEILILRIFPLHFIRKHIFFMKQLATELQSLIRGKYLATSFLANTFFSSREW